MNTKIDQEVAKYLIEVDLNFQQKPVELRFRQGIGAFMFNRILPGQCHERGWQRKGLTFDGDHPVRFEAVKSEIPPVKNVDPWSALYSDCPAA